MVSHVYTGPTCQDWQGPHIQHQSLPRPQAPDLDVKSQSIKTSQRIGFTLIAQQDDLCYYSLGICVDHLYFTPVGANKWIPSMHLTISKSSMVEMNSLWQESPLALFSRTYIIVKI